MHLRTLLADEVIQSLGSFLTAIRLVEDEYMALREAVKLQTWKTEVALIVLQQRRPKNDAISQKLFKTLRLYIHKRSIKENLLKSPTARLRFEGLKMVTAKCISTGMTFPDNSNHITHLRYRVLCLRLFHPQHQLNRWLSFLSDPVSHPSDS